MALHHELPVSLNVLDAAILEALPLGEEGYRREQIAGGLVVYEIRNWVLRVDAERSEALGREMKHWVYEGKAGELRLRELDSGKTEIVWKGIHTFSHRLTSEGQVWEEGNRQEWEQKDKHLRRVLLSLLQNLEHDEALKRALGAERMFYEAPFLQNWEMLYNDYVSVRLPTALEEQQAAAQRGVEAVELHLASGEQAKPQADSGAVAEQLTPAEDEAGKKPGPIDTKLDALLAGQTAIREDLSGLRQAVLARFDASEQTIIATVIERLDQDQLATVETVLNAVEAELVPIGELEETLVAVQHTLSEIQQQGVALPDSTLTSEEFERLSEVVDAPKLDVKHKLKVTVPIIPYFLSYEGEVELKSGLNLEAAWKRLVAKIRDT
jgi:hypothetical protein